jgi:hypothetical protein
MAQGSLEAKGSGVGFEGIGADIKPLLKQFEQLRKQVSDPKVQARIHRAVGKLYKDEMIDNIQDAREVIRIRRGKGKALDIKTGTLRRSIKVWQIDKRFSTFWVGPRVGRRAPKDADGWFANIVEGGDQKFGGNKQKGLFARSIANTRGAALTAMKKKYDFQIRKAAREKAKKQKK